MKENKILTNLRIRIRPLKIEDALDYANLRNEDFVRRYNVLEVISKEAAEEIIRNCEDEEGWGIELIESKEFIGSIDKQFDSLRYKTGTCEISFWLGEKFANKGYMREALESFIDYLFSKDYQGITVRVFEDNERSVRLVEKMGFKRQGRLTNAIRSTDGRIHNDLLYYLSRDRYFNKDEI